MAGVGEADIVKTDGKYLYLVVGTTIYILQAYPPENAQVLLKLSLNGTVAGIFVNGDKLVVFKNGLSSAETLGRTYYPRYMTSRTFIIVYDITNRSSPILERTIAVGGYYFSSRMIGEYIPHFPSEVICLSVWRNIHS